jgi:predicted AlkP superfamily pyrophosphatase or phosphodiesterase
MNVKKRLGVVLALCAAPSAVYADPVLMIAVDGLQPGDVLEAEKRGINIPNLKRFVTEGSYASGVIGVLPTVTYPSHATLITGASPARHGIVGNTTFDPAQINQSGWYWYASDFKVRTLWDAAFKAGLSTANVHWPTTVGATSIRWNLPQYWRTGHADDQRLMKALASPGLVDTLEQDLGQTYMQGIDETIEGDENRGAFAVQLITKKKPQFATVYLTALDHEQHSYGPDTRQAYAVLERIDAIIGKLIAAQMKAQPDSVVAVVSDHGFAKTDTEIGLFRSFIDAGLITLDGDGKVKSWDAMPWPSGGSIAIILARPDDQELHERLKILLLELKANPDARIAAIADKGEISAMRGNPNASFYVDLARGALSAGFKGQKSALNSPAKSKGTHGYFPAAADMRSSFFIMGKPIPKARNLGEIDMRAIAPTIAKIMNVKLPDAEVKPLDLPVLAPTGRR